MEFGKYFADNLARSARERREPGLEESAQRWQTGVSPLSALMPNGVHVSRWRGVIFSLFLLGGLTLLWGSLFKLQVVEGRRNRVLAENNSIFVQRLPAARGVIYDRRGNILARNRPGFVVELLLPQAPQEDAWQGEYIGKVAKFLSVEEAKLKEKIAQNKETPYRSIKIKSNLSQEEQIRIKANLDDYPGLVVREEVLRKYLDSKYFSSVLGYVGRIDKENLQEKKYLSYSPESWVGKAGLEKQYEDWLRGKEGESLVEVTSAGEFQQVEGTRPPQAGKDLHTTLDREFQEFVGQKLEEAMAEYNATGAVFVAVQPGTGEILSMVSLPAYDNNIFVEGNEAQLGKVLRDSRGLLVNRAISGLYPPGSTIKPAVGAAALEEGIINSSTKISDKPQIIRIGQWEFPDWTVSWGAPAHGLMNVREAIAESCDVFFYKIGGGYPPLQATEGPNPKSQISNNERIQGLGAEKLGSYLGKFGLGETTGIDLPGEEEGLVPSPEWKLRAKDEAWFLGNTYHLSIGQGDLLATPLQIANLINVVATEGKMVVPRLNRDLPVEVKDEELGVAREHINEVREGMRLAVTEGIVYPFRDAQVEVAAKTGTAEFGQLNAKGEREAHAWVAGFAPYENPEMSFVVLLEGGGKSENAAKVGREILDWYFGDK